MIGSRMSRTGPCRPYGQRDLYAAFGAMTTRMGEICESYTDEELELIADFLGRTVQAGRTSADELG